MFQLRNDDIDSYVFGFLYSHPNYLCLKEIIPNFFSLNQIDFFGYSFCDDISKMIDSSTYFLNNIKYLMVLCLLYTWFFLLYILRIISARIIKEITEPIIRLTNIVNLNNINDLNQNEDIFKYTFDEEINSFFLSCKKYINGEIKENNVNIKNKEENNNNNNNMIINNKMILELIENQKILNKEDKKIYLLEQIDSNKLNSSIKNRCKTNKSSTHKNKKQNSLGLNLIQLNEIKNEKNSIDKENIYSEINDNNKENNNLKYYENLLNLTEYVYNGRTNKNTNKNNKMRMNMNPTPTRRLVNLKKYFPAKQKDEDEKKNNRKDCKYITYFWYFNAKKNKLFDN
jgi:hypothetical protein